MKLLETSLSGKYSVLIIVAMFVAAIVIVGSPRDRGFAAKARQVEAKKRLLSIFEAETKSFAEHGKYSNDFLELSQADLKSGGNHNLYILGFPGHCSATPEKPKFAINNLDDFAKAQRSRIENYFLSELRNEPCPSTRTFKVFAVGAIGGPELDVWSLDQERHLSNPIIGFPRTMSEDEVSKFKRENSSLAGILLSFFNWNSSNK